MCDCGVTCKILVEDIPRYSVNESVYSSSFLLDFFLIV